MRFHIAVVDANLRAASEGRDEPIFLEGLAISVRDLAACIQSPGNGCGLPRCLLMPKERQCRRTLWRAYRGRTSDWKRIYARAKDIRETPESIEEDYIYNVQLIAKTQRTMKTIKLIGVVAVLALAALVYALIHR